MIDKINEITWSMLVVGTNGNKKILVPAKKENGDYKWGKGLFLQFFEDLNGVEYAFIADLRTKNSLEYYDKDGNLIKDISDYPQVLQKLGLKLKDKVSLETIEMMQNELNTLVEDEDETL